MNDPCDHVWRMRGTWHGKTPDGQPTGGQAYQCDKCGDRATTMEEIKSKGGTVVQNTDIYGRPLKQPAPPNDNIQ
jgi:hypothetical protein